MDIAVDGPNGIFSGLHQKKSKTRLKLWSDSYKQSAVILKKHSAKHLSVCTSGGCQQLIDARSVMKLCLIQPLAAHRWCSFKQHQLSLDILKITFGDSYRELTQPPAAGSEFLHLNIFFQKARTKKILLPKSENQEDRGLNRACDKTQGLGCSILYFQVFHCHEAY